MTNYAQGGPAELRVQFTSSGQPVDPSSVTLKILNGSTVVAGPWTFPNQITRELVGVFTYTWIVPDGTPIDEYTAEWTGIINGANRVGREFFSVVDPYDIVTGPDQTTLATFNDLKQFPALNDVDPERIQGALRAATALVRAYCRAGKPDGWLNPNGSLQPVPSEVRQATAFIARRVAYMPDSGSSQETAGPFSVSRDTSMWMSAAEQMMLSRWHNARGYTSVAFNGPLSARGTGVYWTHDGYGGDLIEFSVEP